jgi:hypothetical protein
VTSAADRAAVHEAGHAVVAVRLWLPLASVSINDAGGGCTSMTIGEWESWAITSFAGEAAERDQYGDDVASEASEGDRRAIREMSRRLSWGAGRLEEFRQRARRLVPSERPATMAIADALRRRGSLSGNDVNAMLPIREAEGRLWVS